MEKKTNEVRNKPTSSKAVDSRRGFLKKLGIATSSLFIAPASILGKSNEVPNENPEENLNKVSMTTTSEIQKYISHAEYTHLGDGVYDVEYTIQPFTEGVLQFRIQGECAGNGPNPSGEDHRTFMNVNIIHPGVKINGKTHTIENTSDGGENHVSVSHSEIQCGFNNSRYTNPNIRAKSSMFKDPSVPVKIKVRVKMCKNLNGDEGNRNDNQSELHTGLGIVVNKSGETSVSGNIGSLDFPENSQVGNLEKNCEVDQREEQIVNRIIDQEDTEHPQLEITGATIINNNNLRFQVDVSDLNDERKPEEMAVINTKTGQVIYTETMNYNIDQYQYNIQVSPNNELEDYIVTFRGANLSLNLHYKTKRFIAKKATTGQ